QRDLLEDVESRAGQQRSSFKCVEILGGFERSPSTGNRPDATTKTPPDRAARSQRCDRDGASDADAELRDHVRDVLAGLVERRGVFGGELQLDDLLDPLAAEQHRYAEEQVLEAVLTLEQH